MTGATSPSDNAGIVYYNGAVVDVGSIMQNLSKSEKARTDTETTLKAIQEENGNEMNVM